MDGYGARQPPRIIAFCNSTIWHNIYRTTCRKVHRHAVWQKGGILMACGAIDFSVIADGRKNVIWISNRLYHKSVLLPRRSECVLVRVLSMQSQCDTHQETHEQWIYVLIFCFFSFYNVKLLSSVIAVVISLQMQNYCKGMFHIIILKNTLVGITSLCFEIISRV